MNEEIKEKLKEKFPEIEIEGNNIRIKKKELINKIRELCEKEEWDLDDKITVTYVFWLGD